MSSVKLHVFRGKDPGIDGCDFRGDRFVGSEHGDFHRTVAEVDPAPEDLVRDVLHLGPAVNQLLNRISTAQPGWADKAASLLGLEGEGPIGLRMGVWDE